MSPKPLISMLFSLSIVAGCATGPDYVKPTVPISEHYQLHPVIAERPSTEANLTDWWQGFNDPQLTHFVQLALQHNLELEQAAARVEQARSGLAGANAALLPAGNISGQASRAYQSLETPVGQLRQTTPDFNRYGNAYELNLAASWELDLFGALRRGKEAALAEYQAAQAGEVATRLAVAAQTADIYISIRGLQQRLEIVQRQIDTQQQLVTLVQLLYSKGLAAEQQVQQAKGALAQINAAVPELKNGLNTAMNAMDVMLGAAPGTYHSELTSHQPLPTVPTISEMGTPGELLRRRPDLIMAERQLAAANAAIGVAMAEYYPTFSLNALLGSATSMSGSNLFSGDANQQSAFLGLRWRLFDFGRINAQIAQAKGRNAELLAHYRLTALRATEDVENAFSALLALEQQTAALTESEANFGKVRAASFASYQRGSSSFIEVLQADNTVLRMSDARVQAQTTAARTTVAAFKALGGGWHIDTELQP